MSETRMTPEAMEAHEGLRRRIDQLERELAAAKAERDRYHADLMRELSNSSKKTEELAKLRQHAEAMAYRIENDEGKSTDIFYKRLCDVAAAYRADFPEDAK